MQEWSEKLQAWREFYAFTGTAAATLMGLMFVVVSLGQRILTTKEGGSRAMRGFFTPIVVFFVTVIIVTMLMLIPGAGSASLGASLVTVAVAGIIYMIASGAHSIWRAGELGLDDLMWYVALPYVSYTAIGVAAMGIWRLAAFGLYTVATAMILLLLIGIRNACDLVTYNIQQGGGDQ